MANTLPQSIADYIEASNARNANAVIGCFTPDAVILDEGQTYRGVDEIRQWIAKTQAAYDFTLEAIRVAEQGSDTIVTCRVTGRFPGSPSDLRFVFTLASDRLAALTIGG